MILQVNWFIILYVVPALATYLLWRWNYKVYEPEGEPTSFDVFSVFCPALNILVMVIGIISMLGYYLGLTSRSKAKEINTRKFFKL